MNPIKTEADEKHAYDLLMSALEDAATENPYDGWENNVDQAIGYLKHAIKRAKTIKRRKHSEY
jgi:hypothetical protein